MAAGSTYTKIQTYTIPSVTVDFTLSSIPSTYTDIFVVLAGGTTSATGVYVQFNGDTGSNYSMTKMYGYGTGYGAGRANSATRAEISGSWSNKNINLLNILNYANTSVYKTGIYRQSDPTDTVASGVILWRSTSAINSIKFTTDSTNFAVGTVITIYGIAAA